MPEQLTTLTLFGLKDSEWRWAMAQMGTANKQLLLAPGLQFHKLMGTGKDKVFTLRPDWKRYAWLAVWNSDLEWEQFKREHAFWKNFQSHSEEYYSIELAPYQSHGYWDGKAPFEKQELNPDSSAIAILTRASLRLSALPSFWRGAGPASDAVTAAQGLLGAIGMGEIPLLKQATFSLWENEAAMKAYAYRDKAHQEVIRKTRALNWYKEELFARFKVLKSEGTWNGRDPLRSQVPQQ